MPACARRAGGGEDARRKCDGWPNTTKTPKMPSAKPKSPTRLTTKALMAAALAEGFLYQKPISR